MSSRGEKRFQLLPNDVHVFLFPLDQNLPGAIELLDEAERMRAERFVFERDRRRFVTAHAWVRVVLGRCLDCRPETVRFETGPRGKPHLADTAVDLRFNLSHAGERALLAVTRGLEVGVDIEQA